jgi:NAD-dependent dihydropyrimidine dehydrogenase PreA subunit
MNLPSWEEIGAAGNDIIQALTRLDDAGFHGPYSLALAPNEITRCSGSIRGASKASGAHPPTRGDLHPGGVIFMDECIECGSCAAECPEEAIVKMD